MPNPIASETWTFKDHKGRKRTARIEIGAPQQITGKSNEDWYCPVFVEGWISHVTPIMGVGPLDSLLNATVLVRSFREYVGGLQISIVSPKGNRVGRKQ